MVKILYIIYHLVISCLHDYLQCITNYNFHYDFVLKIEQKEANVAQATYSK